MFSLEQRFWAKVQKTDGCWLWKGSVHPDGYGRVWLNGKHVRAHRVSWLINVGTLTDTEYVLHRCDVRNSVRPDHLFKGGHAENRIDCVKKMRQAMGSRNGASKLDSDTVRMIRQRCSAGECKRQIARDLHISEGAVRHIAKRRNWAHLQ